MLLPPRRLLPKTERLLLSVKITLNTSIPEARRPQIESMVKTCAGNCTIAWLPSRFPHLVMFIDPGFAEESEHLKGSIFDSPDNGVTEVSLTEILEQRIKKLLSA
jgi:hypothetical protein